MSRSIYVAGGSDERKAAQDAIDRLKLAGWTVTHEWPKDAGYPENGGIPQGIKSAIADIAAVKRAAYVWIRWPAEKSEGAAVEFGTSLAERVNASGHVRCVIVSGPHARCIFAEMADLQFDTHDMAMSWLLEQAP